jgi:hypothetical protein
MSATARVVAIGPPSADLRVNALAVYSWFVRQAVTGARVVARKPTGEQEAARLKEQLARGFYGI